MPSTSAVASNSGPSSSTCNYECELSDSNDGEDETAAELAYTQLSWELSSDMPICYKSEEDEDEEDEIDVNDQAAQIEAEYKLARKPTVVIPFGG
jgi:hypothetical protein